MLCTCPCPGKHKSSHKTSLGRIFKANTDTKFPFKLKLQAFQRHLKEKHPTCMNLDDQKSQAYKKPKQNQKANAKIRNVELMRKINKSIVKQTAILVAGCNLPAAVVESKAFKKLLSTAKQFGQLYPNAELPENMFSRRAMSREINDISSELVEILSIWARKRLADMDKDMDTQELASYLNDGTVVVSITFVLDHKGMTAHKSQHAGITIVIRILKNCDKKGQIRTFSFPIYLEDIKITGGKDFSGNANVIKLVNENFLGEYGRFASLCGDAAVINNQSTLLREELSNCNNCKPMSVNAISCCFHGNMNVQKKTFEIMIIETGTRDYYPKFDISAKYTSQQREYF